jgi:hypothetical protein
MSNTVSAPFGLQPIYHSSGYVRPQQLTMTDNYSTTILQYQPVKLAAGVVVPAAIGDAFIGTFMGVEFTDSDGRRRVSNKWVGGNIGTNIIAYVTSDPYIVYQIQTNAAVNADDIGEQFDFTTVTAGSTTTGLSAVMLDVASSAANAQMRIIGLTPGPDNAWGDTYVIVQVEISKHQNVATIAAY